jgi:hypothetical protein
MHRSPAIETFPDVNTMTANFLIVRYFVAPSFVAVATILPPRPARLHEAKTSVASEGSHGNAASGADSKRIADPHSPPRTLDGSSLRVLVTKLPR